MRKTARRTGKRPRRAKASRKTKRRMSKKTMRRSSKKTRKPARKSKKGKQTAWQKHVGATYRAMRKVNPAVTPPEAMKAAAKTYNKSPKFTSLSMSSVR